MTGLLIRLRTVGWRASYRAHLALLVALDAARYLLVAGALLTHRAHTAVAEHGVGVADVLDDARSYEQRSELDRARYTRLVDSLLFNIDLKEER